MILVALLWGKRVPELLHVALEARGIAAGAGEEPEQEALHAVRSGEVRPRVAVEVLRDLLSLADDLDRLLGQARVLACVRVACRPDRSGGVLPVRDLRPVLGHV